MVYKLLWDNLVTVGIPFDFFFEHFRLRPQEPLSSEIQAHAAEVFPGIKVRWSHTVTTVLSSKAKVATQIQSVYVLAD